MPIADRIRKVMDDNNIKAYSLAKALGYSKNTVVNYKLGRTRPKEEFLLALSQYLKVNYDWLLTGTGEPYLENNYRDKVPLQNSQNMEYESLREQVDELREFNRLLRDENKKLKDQLQALQQGKKKILAG